jgi:hypothetical protein
MKTQVRTRHDEWGKRALALWLGKLGDVVIDARVAGESRRGDVLFTERRPSPGHRRRLGTLGELARGLVLFEPFRNPSTVPEIKACVVKAVEIEAREARAARRARRPRSSVAGVGLCLITPSFSRAMVEEAGARRLAAGERGLYALAPMWRTIVVAVNELPRKASTLWLRLLGRGAVQRAAVEELLALGAQEPMRDATMQLLVAWQQSLPPLEEQSEDERELTMNLERVYERWERKVKAEGRREGKIEGKIETQAEAILVVLEGRGLPVSAAQRKQVLACTDGEQLDRWLRGAVVASTTEALLSARAAARPRAKRSRSASAATRRR